MYKNIYQISLSPYFLKELTAYLIYFVLKIGAALSLNPSASTSIRGIDL